LNLANPSKLDGGWQSGARSNYFVVPIIGSTLRLTNMIDPLKTWYYPIPPYGGIYSPKVVFFRHSEENPKDLGGPYALMSRPYQINCLAVAVSMASIAFGCGAFQNPPQHIAHIFREVIRESFSHCFHTITMGTAASRYNDKAFLNVFGDIDGEGVSCSF
jgi:hypothetical protein